MSWSQADPTSDTPSTGSGEEVSCPQCGHRFSPAARPAPPPKARAPRPKPESLTQKASFGELELSYRWFSPVAIFLVIWCTFWDGFLVVFYGGLIARYMATGKIDWMAALFPTFHLLAGIGVTWLTLGMLFNRTRVIATKTRLRVDMGPIPWAGKKDLDVKDIRQLYVVRKISSSRNGTSTAYDINVIHRSGEWTTLLKGITQVAHAKYIEQEVERFLNIENVPVPEEVTD